MATPAVSFAPHPSQLPSYIHIRQSKTDLARIRDNQRRSRARRKEYLQELEQRLRLCELQGIEASAEIQAAARKVAEENKLLRQLLRDNGVGNERINAYLLSGASTSAESSSSQAPQPTGGPGKAVRSLEHLLGPRRPCHMDSTVVSAGGSTTSLAYSGLQSMDRSRETSVTSVGTWDSPTTQQSITLANPHPNQMQRHPLGVLSMDTSFTSQKPDSTGARSTGQATTGTTPSSIGTQLMYGYDAMDTTFLTPAVRHDTRNPLQPSRQLAGSSQYQLNSAAGLSNLPLGDSVFDPHTFMFNQNNQPQP
jgi:hypothetical protein